MTVPKPLCVYWSVSGQGQPLGKPLSARSDKQRMVTWIQLRRASLLLCRDSNKPSKPICLARTNSLTVFVLFATPVAGWVSRLGYIFRAPLSPLPHFCRFLISVVGCCTVVGCLRVLCCGRCCCPVVRSASEALRAQTNWGALEVLFIIIIIIIINLCPRGLTFSLWKYYGLCLRHKPTELTHSIIPFWSLFLSLWPFLLYFIP